MTAQRKRKPKYIKFRISEADLAKVNELAAWLDHAPAKLVKTLVLTQIRHLHRFKTNQEAIEQDIKKKSKCKPPTSKKK